MKLQSLASYLAFSIFCLFNVSPAAQADAKEMDFVLCPSQDDWIHSPAQTQLQQAQFYNTSSLQRTRRSLILHLRDEFFNYAICESSGEYPRASLVSSYEDFQCSWLSDRWLPLDYFPSVNVAYANLLTEELDRLQEAGESSRSSQRLAQGIGPAFKTMGSVILVQALHHYPQIYGGGRVRGTMVRGVAWVALYVNLMELIRSYHLPPEFSPDAEARALEIEALLRRAGDWSPLGPDLEYSADRLMFTQRDLVEQALATTVEFLCSLD